MALLRKKQYRKEADVPEDVTSMGDTGQDLHWEESVRPEILTPEEAWELDEEIEKENKFDVRISVSQELKDHYDKVIEQRDLILDNNLSEDKSITAILNATTSIIRELGKIQDDLYNSERYAVFQQTVMSTIKECEPEVSREIVERLEALEF